MKYVKPLLALAIALIAALQIFSSNSIDRLPGELAPDLPQQTLVDNVSQITVGKFTLLPQATYDIEARVLSVERYTFDAGANLSPIDFAMGWGVMSDTALLDRFRISQSARFYSIYTDDDTIDIQAALHASANMHLIPADKHVRKVLLSAKRGHIAHLQGYLVKASKADGFTWNTSLTRNDSGDGACELMYVRSATLR